MADEVTRTAYNDAEFAAWVTSQILDEARPYNVTRPFFRTEGRQASNAYDFPIQDDPGAAAGYTEGTGLANTALTTSKATATAAPFGMMATVTDEIQETGVFDVVAQVDGVLGRSVAEKFETDATALLDDFSNTSNTAGVALTWLTLIGAVGALEQRDQVGTPVGVLDPASVNEVRQDVGSSGAALFGNPALPVNGIEAATLAGYAGFAVSGVPIYQTTLVTSTGGGIYLSGVALGLYEVRPLRTEMWRDISLPGTEVVATTRYGMVEIRDAAGQTVLI